MFRNYLRIAWRNLIKNKSYGLVNIFGLTAGLAVVVLITLWVRDELTFNKSFKNYDSISRVMVQYHEGGEVGTGSSVPVPLAAALRENYAQEFEKLALSSQGKFNLTYSDKKFSVIGLFAEPQWPEIFSLEMISGSQSALLDPTSVLLSETMAKKLFNKENAIGEIIRITSRFNLKVAGVYRDFPANTEYHHISFVGPWDFFTANWDWVKNMSDNWNSSAFDLAVQTAKGSSPQNITQKISGLMAKNLPDAREKISLLLFPMSQWHLYDEFDKLGNNESGAIQYVWLFSIIGFFVLLLACINFMNLSTARAEKRAREVGIRKALGSLRSQLIVQFFSESILAVLISFLLSLAIVTILLPWFNHITEKSLEVPWINIPFWLTGLAICLFTGVLAGSYPALYLSSFRPVKVLKGLFKVGTAANSPRKVLVVLQFSVSIFLIIATVIIYKQIQFAKDRPVGYDRKGLLSIHMTTGEIYKNYRIIRDELLRSGAITGITQAQSPITDIWTSTGDLEWPGKLANTPDGLAVVSGSHDYGKVVGWEFIEGRGFNQDNIADSMGLVLNETAVKYMGLKNPVGEIIRWQGKPYTVLGVIKDVMMTSPFSQSIPTIFPLLKEGGNIVLMRLNSAKSMSENIKTINASFLKHNPFAPFEYSFADEDYAQKFKYMERIGSLSVLFAGLAILISLLGLFGITSFMTEQRTKEIGIRKVLGASSSGLWNMLSREMILLIFISIVIALPFGYWAMDNWLYKYEYRFNPTWWIYAFPVIASLAIAFITISIQTLKAANRNPVKSLRSE